jgi:hypothetical protein
MELSSPRTKLTPLGFDQSPLDSMKRLFESTSILLRVIKTQNATWKRR